MDVFVNLVLCVMGVGTVVMTVRLVGWAQATDKRIARLERGKD